jgi:hypothetical protein
MEMNIWQRNIFCAPQQKERERERKTIKAFYAQHKKSFQEKGWVLL